jgi:hypothetical protein
MVPIISPARGAHNSTIEHVYNRDIIYLSSTTPYQDKGEIAYTYASSPDMKNPELPHNLQVRLEIRFKDKAYSTNGTFVGPHHILTSCKHIYNSQEKTWADEIHVSCIKNYPVVKVYIFTEWTRTQNRHYNIALLILGKSIGKYTGWSGMLSVPDIFLQREIVHVLGVQHTIQKITPEEVHCDPKFNSEQAGSSLLVHY